MNYTLITMTAYLVVLFIMGYFLIKYRDEFASALNHLKLKQQDEGNAHIQTTKKKLLGDSIIEETTYSIGGESLDQVYKTYLKVKKE